MVKKDIKYSTEGKEQDRRLGQTIKEKKEFKRKRIS